MLRKINKKQIKKGDLLSQYSDNSFINDKGKIISPKELTFLGAGENSSVWKYKEAAFKIFFAECRPYALTYETYSEMKNLPLNRTLQARELYSEIFDESSHKLDAYVMDYHEEINVSLLDIPTQTLLKNIELMEEDSRVLAENAILMMDRNIENSIINNFYELYFSDIDMYKKSFQTESDILNSNKIEINWFLKQYFIKEVEKLKELTKDEIKFAVFQIFELFKSPMYSKSSEILEDLFSKYEHPKEYFLSIRQKR